MKLGLAIAGDTAHAQFEWLGETVNLQYYPTRFTPKLIANLMDISELANLDADTVALMQAGSKRFAEIAGYTPKALQAIVDALATLLHSWDVEELPGVPYPPTPDNLANLPFDFLMECFVAMKDSISAAPAGKA